MTLLVITGGFAWEPIGRLFTPEPARGMTIVVVAAACIIVDATTAFVFMSGRMAEGRFFTWLQIHWLDLVSWPQVFLFFLRVGWA